MAELSLAPLDVVVLGILGLALLRGLLRGLMREVFSILALAAAVAAVRVFYADFASVLVANAGASETTAPWIAGALLVIAAVAVVALIGRALQRGAEAAGLGWADRTGGAILGVAEGAVLAGVALVLASSLVGRDHPFLEGTHSLAALERLQEIAASGDSALPTVGADR